MHVKLREAMDLVDVRDEPAFAWCVDLLVVGPQLALDGEEQYLQVPFLCEPEAEAKSRSEAKTTRNLKPQLYDTEHPCCFSSHESNTCFLCESQKALRSKPKGHILVFFFAFSWNSLCISG